MSRDKRIEEMRYLADEMGKAISTEYEKRVLADERKLETVLKEHGWRKASEVVDEFIKLMIDSFGVNQHDRMNFDVRDLVELKKKYTEDKGAI